MLSGWTKHKELAELQEFIPKAIILSEVPIICKIPSFLSQFWRCFKGSKVVWNEFVGMLNMTNETHLF